MDEQPRDETHDSIDQATGTLTAEAVARRKELAAQALADGVDDDVLAPVPAVAADTDSSAALGKDLARG